MDIKFYPSSEYHDNSIVRESVIQWSLIWSDYKVSIKKFTEEVTGLKFSTETLSAQIHPSMSKSYPLTLCWKPKGEQALLLLWHELLHRLFSECGIESSSYPDLGSESGINESYEDHIRVYLTLRICLTKLGMRNLLDREMAVLETRNSPIGNSVYIPALRFALNVPEQEIVKELSRRLHVFRNLVP